MALLHVFHKAKRSVRPLVIGMIHLEALPSSPLYNSTIDDIVNGACEDAKIYCENKLDGVLVENMHDVPYTRHVAPDTVAVMTRACCAVGEVCKRFSDNKAMLLGVQVLAGCNREALAIALASGFNFIRAEGFVYAHVADEGLIESCAGDLLRYRRAIGAQHVAVFTDIKKKHSSHSITSDVSLEDTARAAEFCLSNGAIITGSYTGQPPEPSSVKQVKCAVEKLPVIVGSGVDSENAKLFAEAGADALIVGSAFKADGDWRNSLDRNRIAQFMNSFPL